MSRQEEPPSERRSSSSRTVDARQLWSGGAATAVVAALIALVGILVCRWLFNIPILAPRQDGAWGDASTAGYAITAAAAALVATAIMHLLLLTTPRPQMFFSWIIGLATVIAVVYPFSTTAPLSQKVATAFINLVLGTAIGSLINGTAARVIRRRAITGGDQPNYPSSTLGNGPAQAGPVVAPAGSLHPGGVPRPCQNRPKTTVTNGHPRAARTASDLGTRRLTPARNDLLGPGYPWWDARSGRNIGGGRCPLNAGWCRQDSAASASDAMHQVIDGGEPAWLITAALARSARGRGRTPPARSGRTERSPPAGVFPPTMPAIHHMPPGRPATTRR